VATKKLPYEKLNIDIIQVSYTNPRLSAYEGEAFDTLVDTIKEHGVITPLAVNNIDEEYFLIAGERPISST
jgi:ParB-like chromosome segregation protein Spo0J